MKVALTALWLLLAVSMCADYFPRAQSQYELGFNFIGAQTGGTVEVFPCTYAMAFPANFAGTKVGCATASPGGANGYLIKVNGTTIGAVCLSASCNASGDGSLALCTGASCDTACANGDSTVKSCTPGQVLSIVQPAGASGTDVGIGLAFTR